MKLEHQQQLEAAWAKIEALEAANALLKEADRRKDELLAVLCRELRDPLAPIRTAAHLLDSPHLPHSELLWARTVIQRQVRHMSALLDDLLELHGADRAHGEAAVVSRTTEASAPAASRRILVADDNKDAADTLALLLELYGHEVRVAHGGHAALALAQSFRPHIALLDIAMPDLDGHEVARKLRQDASCPDLVLIALTAYGQDEDKERAHEAGFHQHLTKPVDPGKLAVLIAGY